LNFSADVSVAPGPAISFDWTGVIVNQATDFNNTSTFSDGTITGYSWTFGDNGTSSEQNPSHIYATAGLFNVTLSATGDNGCSASLTQEISITSSVEDLQRAALRVYPNPANDEVHIVNDMNQVVELYNALGQKINRTFVTVSSDVVKMNVSDLAPGMYQLTILDKATKKSTTLLIN
jgi:PKD repeat protein